MLRNVAISSQCMSVIMLWADGAGKSIWWFWEQFRLVR